MDVVPQAGTYVARFSMNEVWEGAFLREAIEFAAIKRVAAAITEEQLVLLRRNLRVQAALMADGAFDGFYALDGDMHGILLSFTGFRRPALLADKVWVNVNRARRLVLPLSARVAEILAEHQTIVATLEQRDVDGARQALRHHLRQLLTFLEPLEREHPKFFVTD